MSLCSRERRQTHAAVTFVINPLVRASLLELDSWEALDFLNVPNVLALFRFDGDRLTIPEELGTSLLCASNLPIMTLSCYSLETILEASDIADL